MPRTNDNFKKKAFTAYLTHNLPQSKIAFITEKNITVKLGYNELGC